MMATYCPYKNGPALYLECKECEAKACNAFFCFVSSSVPVKDFVLDAKLDFFLGSKHSVILFTDSSSLYHELAAYAEKRPRIEFWKSVSDQYSNDGDFLGAMEFLKNQKRKGVILFADKDDDFVFEKYQKCKNIDFRIIFSDGIGLFVPKN